MRTLSRPMFNMGGPIKQGIMNGIREPKKDGGQATGRAALVGNPVYPKTGGREHHVIPFLGLGAAAARFLPAAYRGFKAARAYKPWSQNLGWTKRAKDILAPSSGIGIRMGAPGEGAGFRLGSLMRSNPITSLSLAPQAGALGYAAAKGTLKSLPGAAKGYVDMLWPGDSLFKDKEAATGVPLNPNLQKEIAAAKELSNEKKKEFALEQRENRVKKYLEMMGYDRAKKTAIADALIDASKIVGDRGSLDPKNIAQELINPIIQATSKRLDKPDQIREAVGLMATKAEIEKDLEDPSIKALRLEQLNALRGGFEKDIGEFILSAKGTKVKPEALERYARIKANEYGINFKKVSDDQVTGTTDEEKIQSVVKEDGIYMIGDAIIKVTGGVPKHIG